jgi:hypothetical protein
MGKGGTLLKAQTSIAVAGKGLEYLAKGLSVTGDEIGMYIPSAKG